MTVEEIVARHQAAAARQAAALRTLIATGTLTLSFEAPGFPAPVTISSDATMSHGDGVTEIEQREIRINGIAFHGSACRGCRSSSRSEWPLRRSRSR